ncbi:MAG: dienelactone hydrolase family protein [Alphaproteobacteria bacterium]|nr:dienelactone hydrolase family protein [Alphaproteobacteria bacterium]
MGATIRLTAADGFGCDAYLARPKGTQRGGLVVVQEIFGVNDHIRSVVDRYAAEGYLAIAPALYDRVAPRFEVGYGPDDLAKAMKVAGAVDKETVLIDLAAAIAFVAQAGKVGIVGYCWGGTMAWLAAARLGGLSTAVGYYGGGVLSLADLQPQCPVLLHFGAHDAHICVDRVRAFALARPEIPVFVYEAGHGFNCDARASYDPEAAGLAYDRTLRFFAAEAL